MTTTIPNRGRAVIGRAARVLPLVASLALPAAALRAQNCQSSTSCSFSLTGTTGSSLTVGRFTALAVSPSGTFSLRTGSAVSAADYNRNGAGNTGYVDSAPITVTAWSNAAWSVTFTAGAPSPVSKPIGAFSWARSAAAACPSAAAYATLTNAATPAFGTGTGAATPNAGQTVYLCVRTSLAWAADVSGTGISLPLSFTIASP
jgi:hypothetical protein